MFLFLRIYLCLQIYLEKSLKAYTRILTVVIIEGNMAMEYFSFYFLILFNLCKIQMLLIFNYELKNDLNLFSSL